MEAHHGYLIIMQICSRCSIALSQGVNCVAHDCAKRQAAYVAVKEAAVYENAASALAHRYDILPVLCAVLKFSRIKVPIHRTSCNL